MRLVFSLIAMTIAGAAYAKQLSLESWLRTHPKFVVTATLLELLEARGMKAHVLSPSRQLPQLFHARVTDRFEQTVFEMDLAIADTKMGDCHPGIDEPTNVRAMMVGPTAEILAELVARHVPNVQVYQYTAKTLSAIIGLFLRHGKLLNLGLARRPFDAIALEGALPVSFSAPWAYARNRVLESLFEVAAGMEALVDARDQLEDFQATEVLLKLDKIYVVSAPHWRFSVRGKTVPIHSYSHTLTYGYHFPRVIPGTTLEATALEERLYASGLRDGDAMAVTQFEAAWYVAKALFPALAAAQITYMHYPPKSSDGTRVVEPIPLNCGAILTGEPLIKV